MLTGGGGGIESGQKEAALAAKAEEEGAKL